MPTYENYKFRIVAVSILDRLEKSTYVADIGRTSREFLHLILHFYDKSLKSVCVENVDLLIVINKSKVCLKQADNRFTSLPCNKQKLETVENPTFTFENVSTDFRQSIENDGLHFKQARKLMSYFPLYMIM